MSATLLALFGLLENAPTVAADSVALYSTVAHGEGGLAKVQAAVAALSKLVDDAVSGAVPQKTA
jgi:hypothetical protein